MKWFDVRYTQTIVQIVLLLCPFDNPNKRKTIIFITFHVQHTTINKYLSYKYNIPLPIQPDPTSRSHNIMIIILIVTFFRINVIIIV